MASIINSTTTAGVTVTGDNSGSLQLATNNGTTALTIDTSQNVGVGTGSPAKKLDVSGTGRFTGELALGNDLNQTTDGYIYSSNGGGGVRSGFFLDGTNQVVKAFTAATERMRIDSSGRVTMPFQPAFRAFRSSSVSVAASGVVVFDSTSTNIGSNYNTSNGRFTAPVAGMYQFAVQLLFEGLSNGNECECSIYVNGGGVLNFGPRVKYQADYTGFNGYVSMFASISIYLNANDYVQAAQITSGARTVYGSGSGVWTVFSGFLIG